MADYLIIRSAHSALKQWCRVWSCYTPHVKLGNWCNFEKE